MARFDGLSLEELEKQAAEVSGKVERLARERDGLEVQMRPIREMYDEAARSLSASRDILAGLRLEIERRRRPKAEPTVTDHALVRYIERVHEIDMDALRTIILSETVRMAMDQGAVSVRSGGLIYHLENNSVVTIGLAQRAADRRKPSRLTRAQRERLEDGDEDEPFLLSGDEAA